MEGETWSMHSYGAVFCEARVNTDTGELRVSRVTGIYDCGKILNAKTAASQLRGGIIMALGMAMMEETLFDERNGRIINASMAEYHVPVHLDIPAIDVPALPGRRQRFDVQLPAAGGSTDAAETSVRFTIERDGQTLVTTSRSATSLRTSPLDYRLAPGSYVATATADAMTARTTFTVDGGDAPDQAEEPIRLTLR